MKPEFRLWIENEEGEQLIGEGILELLQEIDKTGSLNQASQQLNMSYRTAWGKVEKAEERLDLELVIRRAGGGSTGGTTLTDKGRKLIAKFSELKGAVGAEVENKFSEIFSDFKQN